MRMALVALALTVAPSARLVAADDDPTAEDQPLGFQPMTFTPQPHSALDGVEVQVVDTGTGTTKKQTKALTDLWLRASSSKTEIEELLKAANTSAPDKFKFIFDVEVFSVVDGRLHSDTMGHCSGWQQDVSWCQYGCDGQSIAVRRSLTDGEISLTLLLASKAPEQETEGAVPAARPLGLTLCGAGDDGMELRVVPANGRATGTLPLKRGG